MVLSTLTTKLLRTQFPFCESVPEHVAEMRENICRVFDCLYSFLYDAIVYAAWTCLPLSVLRARFFWSSTENIAICEIFKQECHTSTTATVSRLHLKCDGTRAETRFRLSAKRTSPFKSAGASVQSTTGSRGVRISGSNAGYTMFWGSVKGTGYSLRSPFSPSLPLPASPCDITFQLDSTTPRVKGRGLQVPLQRF